MLIKNFIMRNKPIFYIGFFTLILFIVIILVSEVRRINSKNLEPRLVEVEESTESSTAKTMIDSTNYMDSTFFTKETTPSYTILPESEYAEMDIKYGTVVIEYTDEGFTPSNAKTLVNQKVKWLNKSEHEIFITQKTKVYQQFEKPILIPSEGSAEFRMYKDGLWKYEEEDSNFSGTINVIKP